jgi:hypothetical protein
MNLKDFGVDKRIIFKWIGGGADEDVTSRIKKANVAFVQLYRIWKNKNIRIKTNYYYYYYYLWGGTESLGICSSP